MTWLKVLLVVVVAIAIWAWIVVLVRGDQWDGKIVAQDISVMIKR